MTRSGSASGQCRGLGRRRWPLVLLTLVVMFAANTALAQPLSAERVPAELQPWVPWVLDEVGDDACTLIDDTRVCAWLGELTLSVAPSGGTFSLRVMTERRTRVPLPGAMKLWPQAVTVDGKGAVVLDHNAAPSLMLDAGRHQVEGRLLWQKMPEVLAVPASVARVSLTLGGQQIVPRRQSDGGVWLGGQEPGATEAEEDRLDLEVMRRVEDGVPLVVITRIELRAAGRPREVRLDNPLLRGGELLSLTSGQLDSRVDTDGTLVLAVKKGKHVIELHERHVTPPELLELAARAGPWPAAEVWVWRPDVALRQAEIAGGTPIDPSRTELPAEWRDLQAFTLKAPASFQIRTQRRGHPDPQPNQLILHRNLWLDLDGGGFTAVDRLQGTMHRDWRLQFTAAGELGHVESGHGAQLITLDPATQRAGVELRDSAVSVTAEWRGNGAPSRLQAVGWASDVEGLSLDVNLPPGWELLAASGADEVSPSRLDDWQPLHWAWLLVVTLGVGKLLGWRWAPLAALALLLSHESPFAPWWLWGALLAAMALMRKLPAGKLHTAARLLWWGSAALLAFALVSFGAQQARALLFPHAALLARAERDIRPFAAISAKAESPLEAADNKEGGSGTRARGDEGSMGKSRPKSITRDQLEQQRGEALNEASEFGMVGKLKAGAGGDADAPAQKWSGKAGWLDQQQGQRSDPNAIIQTGQGVPDWRFSRTKLRWAGPVEQAHQLRLWLLSPAERAALTALGVLLTGWLGLMLIAAGLRTPPPRTPPATPSEPEPSAPRRQGKARGMAAAAAVLLACALSSVAAPLYAEAPPDALLEELKKRLTRAPECAPNCVSVSRLTLRNDGDVLEIVAEVHAGASTSYPLPGPAASWLPARIEVDKKADQPVVQLDGQLRLRLAAGTHEVRLRGPLAGDEITLALGALPHRVQHELTGWEVDGIDQDGHPESSIVLRRARRSQPNDQLPTSEAVVTAIPPWLEVTRTLDASVSWTIHTRLRRLSAVGAPIVVRFPLLPGEKVLDGGFPQEAGELVVTLARDALEASFKSALTPGEQLVLSAPAKRPWNEVWVLRCSEIWRCSSHGLDPVAHVGNAGQGEIWLPTFRPWPGERLTLDFQRPAPAPGRSLTVLDATLTLQPRERNNNAALDLTLETSTGGIHKLRVPEGVRVTQLTVDGVEQPATEQGGEQKITVKPGRHAVRMRWQQAEGLGLIYRAPEVVVGDQVTNARVVIGLVNDRWVVFAGGPRWGPEIQLWAYLALLALLALVISRVPRNPLRTWQWLLLALGLSQVPWWFAAIIASWFFVVAHRADWRPSPRWHNAMQVALVLWTFGFVVALGLTCFSGVARHPDMMIDGGYGGGQLSWYLDHSAGSLPRPWLVSTSVWFWRMAMAAWSAWVALLLVRQAPQAWRHFQAGGLWRTTSAPPASAAAAVSPAGSSAPAPASPAVALPAVTPSAATPPARDDDPGDDDPGDDDPGDDDPGDDDPGDDDPGDDAEPSDEP